MMKETAAAVTMKAPVLKPVWQTKETKRICEKRTRKPPSIPGPMEPDPVRSGFVS